MTTGLPDVKADIAFTTDPLDATPSYEDVSSRVRGFDTGRGRSYELDRMEAGTSSVVLNNRDAALTPSNTASPYYPDVISTRRLRLQATWASVDYPRFAGFTEGYPVDFPAAGFDSLVQIQATDWFLALSTRNFRPATTTVGTAITATPAADTEEQITVASTALPMPQAVPFTIKIDSESMLVQTIDSSTVYTVLRGQDSTTVTTHALAASVTTEVVSFDEELSGTRIQNCLDMVGIDALDVAIDAGQSLIAASTNLAGTSFLEHVLLIAEAENGRFFAANDGTLTFIDRQTLIISEETSRGTFGDGSGAGSGEYGEGEYGDGEYGGSGSGVIPYLAAGVRLDNDDTKLYNVVVINLPDGTHVEARDQDSIDAHNERTLTKDWPLAETGEAQSAAEYLLGALKDGTTRVPSITIAPQGDPSVLWPAVLPIEIGQHYTFAMTPQAGDPIAVEVVVDGIQDNASPGRWTVGLQLVPFDDRIYWQLDRDAGDPYGALDGVALLRY